uniref:Tudor domain-containing protein n=1 Tax=Haptolina ericina TaxID=156174 RepID=A0A7S3ETI3_9EUKA
MPADEESNKSARPEPVLIDTLGLAEGDRIEVAWQVEMTDGTEETMWWAATLSTVTDEEAVGDEYVLTYEAQHGFEVEQRRVVFSSDTALWDAVLRELLDWRREGEESDGEGEAAAEEGELQLDAAVKARFQGQEAYHAGTVAAVNADGTYDILYEDNVMEQNVPRDMIQLVSIAPSVQAAIEEGRGDVAAESINDFFDLFVRGLTSGDKFASLTAEQQAHASDKVRAMRPHFEAELLLLRDERGRGAQVTGEDIKLLLPRVISRSRSAEIQ